MTVSPHFAFIAFAIASTSCAGTPRPTAATGGASESVPPASVAVARGKSTPIDDAEDAKSADRCADASAEYCVPPNEVNDRLCAKLQQETTLILFAKGTPFTRIYTRGRIDELDANEELIVLRFRPPQKNGIIVGANVGTFDVLRWDGTCSRAVEASALTRTRPPEPRAARVIWHRLGEKMQDSLVTGSEKIKLAHARRGKECRGAMSGEVSAACEKADRSLGNAIVDYVRAGGALPSPADGS